MAICRWDGDGDGDGNFFILLPRNEPIKTKFAHFESSRKANQHKQLLDERQRRFSLDIYFFYYS